MEHGIRKHCTIHFNEDPAFYQALSLKLEHLIQQHREDWEALTRELTHLRNDAVAGRKATAEGLTREETTFFDHLVQLTFGTVSAPPERVEAMKKLAAEMVEILQGSIGIVDFWSNPAEQARLRGELADVLLMADIPDVTANFNRLAVEVLKLAKHRREQLVEVVQR
jgi:type I restriction enzyme R subunit